MEIEESDSHLVNLVIHKNRDGTYETTCLVNPGLLKGQTELSGLLRHVLESDVRGLIVDTLVAESDKAVPGTSSVVSAIITEKNVVVKPVMGLDYLKGLNFQIASMRESDGDE